MTTNAKRDGWLTRAHIDAWARMYLADADTRDPHASLPWLAESKLAWKRFAEFVDAHHATSKSNDG